MILNKLKIQKERDSSKGMKEISNKEIGFAVVKELCQKFGGDVFLTSRDDSTGQGPINQLKKKMSLIPSFIN